MVFEVSAGELAAADAYEVSDYERACLLYTSDAADDLLCVDLGGRRIIKKKKFSITHAMSHTPPNP